MHQRGDQEERSENNTTGDADEDNGAGIIPPGFAPHKRGGSGNGSGDGGGGGGGGAGGDHVLLNRRLKYSKFEDAIIMSGVEEHGRNWSAILAGAGDYVPGGKK